jgi:Tfp pilus assembly ATPase PilU
VSQRLVPKASGGRLAVCEILRSNSRTREYIQEGEREGKSLNDAIEDGVLEGMQSFDGELYRLILAGTVDREVALSYATNRTNLQLRLDTQAGAEKVEPVKSGTGSFRAAGPAGGRRAAGPKPESDGLEDLIER